MPRRVLVRYTSLVDHPITFEASLGILLLVTRHANYLLVTWYKTLASYWLLTDFATEALLMPLLALVLELLHTCFEEAPTAIATRREVVVMTVGAIETIVLVGERLVDQRHLTVAALKTSLVPVLVFVRQVL